MHPLAVLEGRQDDVRRHRRLPEDLFPHRIRDRIHHRAVAGADRRLADAARADRCLRIRQAQREGRPGGMAKAGEILGYIDVVLFVVGIVFVVSR